MKAKDFIDIFEYTKMFNKPPKTKRPKRKEYEINNLDLVGAIETRRRELKALESFLEDQVKIYKKEDKKDDKDKKEEKAGWDAPKIALWLMLTFPITGPLYLKFLSVMIPGILK